MDHISETLTELRTALVAARDNEISMASEVLTSYVQDHNGTAAYREIDRQVNALAKAWDKMIAKLGQWAVEAEGIESTCENFYGDDACMYCASLAHTSNDHYQE